MNIIFVKQVRKEVKGVAVEADLLQTAESLVAEEQLPKDSEEQLLGRHFRRLHVEVFQKNRFTLGAFPRVKVTQTSSHGDLIGHIW